MEGYLKCRSTARVSGQRHHASSERNNSHSRPALRNDGLTRRDELSAASSRAVNSCATAQRRRRRVTQLKVCLLVASVTVMAACMLAQLPDRVEAALAMNLPDGIENILGFVPKSSFQCERDGYFGDIDNDCRLFHLCQRNVNPTSGKVEWRHWTYACGNQTMFNQLTLTCAFVDEAIPCRHASQFQYLNEVIHKPAEPFLTDADVTSGFSYYSNRIMSDGARARAFQDSQLLAQIGGNSLGSSSSSSSSSFAASNQFNSPRPIERNDLVDDSEDSQAAPRLNRNQEQSSPSLFRADFNAAADVAANPQDEVRVAPGQPENERLVNQFVSRQTFEQNSAARQVASPVIESHSFQFQHQPSLAQDRQQQQQQPLRQQFQPLARDLQEQFNAPLPVQQQQPQQQLQTTNGQNQAANLFEFSIATNHQPGPFVPSQQDFPAFPALSNQQQQQQQFFTLPRASQQQQQQPQQAQQAQESNQVDLRAQFGPRAPSQPAVQELAATSAPVTLTNQPAEITTTTFTVQTPSSTLAPTFTSTQRLQLAQPTQATTSTSSNSFAPVTQATPVPQTSPTTTTTTAAAAAATTTPFVASSGGQQATTTTRRSPTQTATTTTTTTTTATATSTATAAPTTSTSSMRQQARRLINPAGFQSTRLSSLNRRTVADTPLVMRRQAQQVAASSSSSSAPVRHHLQPAQSQPQRRHANAPQPAQSAGPQSAPARASFAPLGDRQAEQHVAAPIQFQAGADFWRRSFDVQLMAPKFESLLLRRRV